MAKRQRHTTLSVNLSESGERYVPQRVKNQVDQNYMIGGVLYCPFLMMSFVRLGKRPAYAHIVPKCEQNILTKKQDVVNHPDNLVPTIGIVHEQMELHKTLPGFTLEYLQAHPDKSGKDIYVLRLASHITEDHILLHFVHADQQVVMPAASRQFWHIHKSVFDLCHRANAIANDRPCEPQHVQYLLNSVLFNLVTTHIALPILQRLALQSLKAIKCNPSRKHAPAAPNSILSQANPSFAVVAREVREKRSFQLKSTWFVLHEELHGQTPEYFDIDVMWHTPSKKTFDFISRQDFTNPDKYDHLIRIYKGRPIKGFTNLIYFIEFDALLQNLRPGSLSSLECSPPLPPSLTSSTNSGFDGDQSADVLHRMNLLNTNPPSDTRSIMDGAALARKKRAGACKPPTKESASVPSSSSSRSGRTSLSPKQATPPVSLIRKRTGRLHVENVMVEVSGGATVKLELLSADSLVTVSPSATMYAGEVCTVRYVEHQLKGSRMNFMLQLELRGKTFRMPSEFVQITSSSAQMTPDPHEAIGNDGVKTNNLEPGTTAIDDNKLSDDDFDVSVLDSDTEDSAS